MSDASGGSSNGQTRLDVTIYHEAAPVSALDRFLWLEAERMRRLSVSQEALDREREVVKDEIRLHVQDDPHGLFEGQELPALLFDRWENAHDGYGDFTDLDAATLYDAGAFFEAFYRPANAVLAVVGDVDAASVLELADELFGPLGAGPVPLPRDLREERRRAPVLARSPAPLATTPAVAAGWRMPPRDHRDAVPLLVLGELLHDGRTARLYRALVERKGLATDVSGGFNPFQGELWYHGTTLFLSRIVARASAPPESVLDALDKEISEVALRGVPGGELSRVKTKLVTGLLASLASAQDLSTELALAFHFDGSAARLARLPEEILAVTGEEIARAARWLDPSSRAAVVKVPSRKGRR